MNNQIQESVEQKFAEIYFSDGMYNNRLISDQVKAEEHKWQFDRYSKYPSPLSWADAEAKFKKMLTPEELSMLSILYTSEEYADVEQHDTERYHREIIVTLNK